MKYVIIHNTLCILGALAASTYLTVNDHLGMAISSLVLEYLSLSSYHGGESK